MKYTFLKQSQKDTVKFLLKHSGKWLSYSKDYETVEMICALSNLGIAKINDFGQFSLKSEKRAKQYLGN